MNEARVLYLLSVVNNREKQPLFNAQKIQKNPIFQISVDILSNTNFFRAFTASANALAITPVIPAHARLDLLSMLDRKTFCSDNPDNPVLQMLCGSRHSNLTLNNAELMKNLLKGSRHFSHTKQVTKPV
ncbi:hypothetical protein Tco_1175276 [Tanacetum coccineum]